MLGSGVWRHGAGHVRDLRLLKDAPAVIAVKGSARAKGDGGATGAEVAVALRTRTHARTRAHARTHPPSQSRRLLRGGAWPKPRTRVETVSYDGDGRAEHFGVARGMSSGVLAGTLCDDLGEGSCVAASIFA